MIDKQILNADLILCATFFLTIYLFVSSLIQHKKLKFLHQTAIAILIGFLFGGIIYFSFPQFFSRLVNFNSVIVFYILLPPMIFSSGINLKKRRFFQNIYYINIFGIIGTTLNFIIIASLTYMVSQLGWIRDWTNFQQIRQLQTWQILLFAACLCSIDPIASQIEIKPQYTPKLYSIIFGQTLMKDAITIVLFKSITKLVISNGSVSQFTFYWYTSFQIIFTFIVDFICSILIGIIFASLFTLIFKKFRFILHDKGVTQIGLIFLCGYMSYFSSQILGFSGVVAMLFCGIFHSHFNIYNMSKQGIQSSKVTFKSIALLAEGLLFVILGITSWQIKTDSSQGIVISQSWTFLLASLIIIIIARFVNIFLINYLFRLIKGKDKWRLNIYQLEMIFMVGIVKGAVPFALTNSITLQNQITQVTTLIIKSNIIIIVFLTSVILNGLIPMYLRNRIKEMKNNLKQNDPSLHDSLIHSEKKLQTTQSKKFRSTTQKYWRKFEQGILKPFFIFNYLGRKQEIKLDKLKEKIFELEIESESNQGDVQNVLSQINQKSQPSLINKQSDYLDDNQSSDQQRPSENRSNQIDNIQKQQKIKKKDRNKFGRSLIISENNSNDNKLQIKVKRGYSESFEIQNRECD